MNVEWFLYGVFVGVSVALVRFVWKVYTLAKEDELHEL